MNRFSGLILALSLGVAISGCASAGTTSGSSDGQGSKGSATSTRGGSGQRRQVVQRRGGTRPTENKSTRDAKRSLGMALLKATPAEQEVLYREALKHAQASIEAEPENALGWLLAGQAYAKLKDYPAADSTFTQAVKLHRAYAAEVDTEREDAWIVAYNEAITAYQGGDIPGAIRGLEAANRMYRKRPEALYLLGSFYANQNETEKSVESYQAVLSILRDPEFKPEGEDAPKQWKETEEEVVSNLGMLLTSLEREAEAEKVYREYLERNPDHLATEVSLAISLTRQNKTAEAAEVFSKISTRSGLTDGQLLTIGIGLFNANDFKGAADAFRSAAEQNPYSRDAHLNLSKALLRQSLVLEEAKVKQTNDADDARLIELYREMISAGEKTLELDPFNGEVLTYMMRSHQGLSQLLPQASARSQHDTQLKATVRRSEALPLEVDQLSLRTGSDEVIISGSFKNLKLAAGASVTLKFTILSATGAVLGTESVTSAAAAKDQRAQFSVTVPVKGEMSGWKYERVQ